MPERNRQVLLKRRPEGMPTPGDFEIIDAPFPALGILGMPGMTAYIGLANIGQPKEGETVVVSAASGAVGAVAGQLAKRQGARVVGIAGGADKCRYVKDELGFDAALDHRSPDLD